MGKIAGDFFANVDAHNDGSRMMKKEMRREERNDYMTGFGRGYTEVMAEWAV